MQISTSVGVVQAMVVSSIYPAVRNGHRRENSAPAPADATAFRRMQGHIGATAAQPSVACAGWAAAAGNASRYGIRAIV